MKKAVIQEAKSQLTENFSERLGEYLRTTRGQKSKTDAAQELGVTFQTYGAYEQGTPGPRGVTLDFLCLVANRDKRSLSNLIAELEQEKLPEELVEASQAHRDFAKLFREEPPEEIQRTTDTLQAQFAGRGRYNPPPGHWALNFLEKAARLPRADLIYIEEQIYRYLVLSNKMTEQEGKERMDEIFSERLSLAMAVARGQSGG